MQYLSAYITQSPPHAESIIGPQYLLHRTDARKLVDYLKSHKKWTYAWACESDALIDHDVLFDQLSIFGREIETAKARYSLDFGDINGYFAEGSGVKNQPGLPLKNTTSMYLCIEARSKVNEAVQFRQTIDIRCTNIFRERYGREFGLNGEVRMHLRDAGVILEDKRTSFMYEFHFRKFHYYLVSFDPWDFIIKSDEDWFTLEG